MLGVAAVSGPVLLVGLGAFGHCVVQCKPRYGLVFTTLFFPSFLFPLSFALEHGSCAATLPEQSPQSPGRGGQSAARWALSPRPGCSPLPRGGGCCGAASPPGGAAPPQRPPPPAGRAAAAAAPWAPARPREGAGSRLSRPGPASPQRPPGRPRARARPRDAAAGGPWRRLPVTARGGARCCAPAASGSASGSGSAGGPGAARPRPWADGGRRPPQRRPGCWRRGHGRPCRSLPALRRGRRRHSAPRAAQARYRRGHPPADTAPPRAPAEAARGWAGPSGRAAGGRPHRPPLPAPGPGPPAAAGRGSGSRGGAARPRSYG